MGTRNIRCSRRGARGRRPPRRALPLPRRAAETAAAAAATPHFAVTQIWQQTLNDPNNEIALSSPNVADLDGQPSVVVGDRGGHVYAFHLSDGAGVAGWPYDAGAPVDSSPSVAPIDAGGLDTVYVGTGNVTTPARGATRPSLPTVATSGSSRRTTRRRDPTPHSAVSASLTVGGYAGGYGVEAGSLGQNANALAAANGAMLAGFPWFTADSVFSTAALADLYADGNSEIVSGGDSSAGVAYGQTYTDGGHIRILSSAGNAGTGNPAGGLICQYNTTQNIDRSSPAVGQFLSGGAVGIAIGDGSYYPGASDSDKVFAINTGCGLAWSDTLDGHHRRLAGPGRRRGQRPAGRGGGDADRELERHDLRAERQQRGHPVVGPDLGCRPRLAGDGRSHRWRLPGRPRPDDGGHRRLRRAFGRPGGHHRRRVQLPELPSGDRRPQREHRDHRGGLPVRRWHPGQRHHALGDRWRRLGLDRRRVRRLAPVPPRPPADR